MNQLKKHRKRALALLNHRRNELRKELAELRANESRYSKNDLKARKITLQRKFSTLKRRRERLIRLFRNRGQSLNKKKASGEFSSNRISGMKSPLKLN